MNAVGRKNSAGFTLIEILVVLVIMGVGFSFVMLSVSDFGQKKKIKTAAEEFKQYILLLEHQAILESSTLGVRLDQHSYQVLRFNPPSNWVTLGNNRLFQLRNLPKGAVIELQKNKQHGHHPYITINAAGELSPFVMIWGSEKEHDLYRLSGQYNGVVVLEAINSP